MIDYILGGKELEFLRREVIIEFVKDRLNRSLKGLKIDPIFECDKALLEDTSWFYHLIKGTSHKDFFDVRPVEYSVQDTDFSPEELF